jgi:hypothetical protein
MNGAASKEDDCKNVGSIIGPMNSFNNHLPDELRTGFVVLMARWHFVHEYFHAEGASRNPRRHFVVGGVVSVAAPVSRWSINRR